MESLQTEWILTAQAGAFAPALAEAGHPRVVRQLEPGVALCFGVQTPERPIFLRHMCPAGIAVPLIGETSDLVALCDAAAPLTSRLDASRGFSVQTRIIEGYQPAYKRFDVNTALAALLGQSGAAVDVKAPAQIVSVTLAEGTGWVGLSTPGENLSDWAGGARRFKWEAGQISRAEFKLLEALETFQIATVDGGRALDLGAAPGGWTRVLRRHGMAVTAVDPAALDAGLARDKRVAHARVTAQQFFKSSAFEPFDLLVNDMKMDSDESARLTVDGARCLKPSGAALLTLKLPDKADEWLPRVRRAEAILRDAYQICGVRQLFHNRSEVTAYVTRL